MDAGFYSADYLRAWVRSAQLRSFLTGRFGEGWWRDRDAGEFLRGLFAEGTEPSSEEIAERLAYAPHDTGPLLDELGVPTTCPRSWAVSAAPSCGRRRRSSPR